MKALVGAFNQEKALVGTFSVIVQPVVEPMDRFAALYCTVPHPRPQEHGRGQPRPARGVVAPVVSEDHAAGGEVRALRGQVGQQTLGHLQHRKEGVLLNTY